MKNQQDASSLSSTGNITLAVLIERLDSLSHQVYDRPLDRVHLEADEVLFRQGDESDSMYVLLSGRLGVRIERANDVPTEINELRSGAVVGEMTVLTNQTRTATIYARKTAVLLQLNRDLFNKLSAQEKNEMLNLDATIGQRWQHLQLTQALNQLFGPLQPAALNLLYEQLEWHHLSNGDVLFHEGDAADGLYLVVNGRLRAAVTGEDGQPQPVGEIGQGESVGELAVLTDTVRAATVYAVRETNVVQMSPQLFHRFMQETPGMMLKLTRILVTRQQQTLGRTVSTKRPGLTLAILPAGPAIDARPFAHQLGQALSRYGSVVVLDTSRFDEQFGQAGASQIEPQDPGHTAVVSHMGKLEAEHDYVLLAADQDASPWTERCINQADRALLLAVPSADTTPGPPERLLAKREVPVHTELVLHHPAHTQRPQNTAAWLNGRRLDAYHHIREGDDGHMQRLARRLTGNAICLVLSGGGARGYAHVGVHRAFEELDIPIDYIGATSMGAIIGAAILTLGSNAAILNECGRYASPGTLFDRTLPITSLMSSNKVTKSMQQLFGEARIEDQWIPFFCVASNLTTAEPIVYDRGPMWRAIRASLSLPGIFTPVMENGDVVVDGGVMHNFPVRLTAERVQSRHIIGVNINPHRERKRQYDLETGISGWRLLMSRLNPFVKTLRAPSLVNTIQRAIIVNSIQRTKEEEDLLAVAIHPSVRRFSLMAYDEFATISQVGYEAAIEPLTAWKLAWEAEKTAVE